MFEHWHEPVLVDLNITCGRKEETSNFGFAVPMPVRWPQHRTAGCVGSRHLYNCYDGASGDLASSTLLRFDGMEVRVLTEI